MLTVAQFLIEKLIRDLFWGRFAFVEDLHQMVRQKIARKYHLRWNRRRPLSALLAQVDRTFLFYPHRIGFHRRRKFLWIFVQHRRLGFYLGDILERVCGTPFLARLRIGYFSSKILLPLNFRLREKYDDSGRTFFGFFIEAFIEYAEWYQPKVSA